MAALICFICSLVKNAYDFSEIYLRGNSDLLLALEIFRYRQSLQLFEANRRAYYHRQREDMAETDNSNGSPEVIPSTAVQDTDMSRCCSTDKCNGNQLCLSEFEVIGEDIDYSAVDATLLDDDTNQTCTDNVNKSDWNSYAVDSDPNNDFLAIWSQKLSVYEAAHGLEPYHIADVTDPREGVSYTITAYTKTYCEWFSLSFIIENATRDIALYIKPRLPHNYVVRNSRANRTWGREEVACPLPFNLRRGFKFTMEILFTEPCYMISINGQHFCKFDHRLPYRLVKTIEITGHLREVLVERMIVDCYPIRSPQNKPRDIILGKSLQDRDSLVTGDEKDSISSVDRTIRTWDKVSWSTRPSFQQGRICDNSLPLPFYGSIDPSSFGVGRVFKIEGRVKLLPQSFYINLQNGCDIWPHPEIALHLNTLFTKQNTGAIGRTTLVRNAWKDGGWGVEERSDLLTHLRPGKLFSMCIVNNTKCFDIYVNHKLLATFKYRMHPASINTIYIQGDIKLWDVMLEQGLSFDEIHSVGMRRRSSTLRV